MKEILIIFDKISGLFNPTKHQIPIVTDLPEIDDNSTFKRPRLIYTYRAKTISISLNSQVE